MIFRSLERKKKKKKEKRKEKEKRKRAKVKTKASTVDFLARETFPLLKKPQPRPLPLLLRKPRKKRNIELQNPNPLSEETKKEIARRSPVPAAAALEEAPAERQQAAGGKGGAGPDRRPNHDLAPLRLGHSRGVGRGAVLGEYAFIFEVLERRGFEREREREREREERV